MWLPPGTVLDITDDVDGAVLKDVFPDSSKIPDYIKSAMSLRKVASLDDHHFSLVFTNHGETFRKYAHVDPGHTALSIIYFLKHAHLLPKVAQAHTAYELQRMARVYDLPVPEPLHKTAFLAALGNAAWKGGKWLVGSVAKDPMKAMGTVMTGMAVKDTAGQIGDSLRQAWRSSGNVNIPGMGGGH